MRPSNDHTLSSATPAMGRDVTSVRSGPDLRRDLVERTAEAFDHVVDFLVSDDQRRREGCDRAPVGAKDQPVLQSLRRQLRPDAESRVERCLDRKSVLWGTRLEVRVAPDDRTDIKTQKDPRTSLPHIAASN